TRINQSDVRGGVTSRKQSLSCYGFPLQQKGRRDVTSPLRKLWCILGKKHGGLHEKLVTCAAHGDVGGDAAVLGGRPPTVWGCTNIIYW
ncbi:hypothetical protein GDO81_019315, partial [Engystomops pustulosus]